MKDAKELKSPIYEPSYESLLASSSLIELAEILKRFIRYKTNTKRKQFYDEIRGYIIKAKIFNLLFFGEENPRLKRLFYAEPFRLPSSRLSSKRLANIEFLNYIKDQYEDNIKILEDEFLHIYNTKFLRDIIPIIDSIKSTL